MRGDLSWIREVHLTLNSGFPGEPLNPFIGIYDAETRQDPASGIPIGGWYPEQRLVRAEALKAYTVEAAFSDLRKPLKEKLLKECLQTLLFFRIISLRSLRRNFLSLK